MDDPTRNYRCCDVCDKPIDVRETGPNSQDNEVAGSYLCSDCTVRVKATGSDSRPSCCHCNQADGIHHLLFELDDDHPPHSAADHWLCNACWERPEFIEHRWKYWHDRAVEIFERLTEEDASEQAKEKSDQQDIR